MIKWITGTILLLSVCASIIGQTIRGGTIRGGQIGNDPAIIPGLSAWYSPESTFIIDTSLSTNTVSSWGDRSGNGHNITQGTKANQPPYGVTNSVNGYLTLRFNGAQRLIGTTSITNLVNGDDIPYSCFSVVNIDASANEVSFGWGNSTNATPTVVNRPIITASYRNSRTDDAATTVNASTGANTSTNTVWQVQGYSFSGTAAIMQCNTFKANPSHNVGSIKTMTFCVGAFQRNGTFANSLNGNIAEVVIYNRRLTQDEFNLVIKYLNDKYKVF